MFIQLLHLPLHLSSIYSLLPFPNSATQRKEEEEEEGIKCWNGRGENTTVPLPARLDVQLKSGGRWWRWRWWWRGERERKTVLIDTWGVNPLEMSEKGWKEPHKRQRSVTGERRSEGGGAAEPEEEEEVEEFLWENSCCVRDSARAHTGRISRIYFTF